MKIFGPLNYIFFSLRRTAATINSLKHIPESGKFLFAYFCYTDAITTIASIGILFAMQEMGVGLFDFIIIAIIVS